jgi:ectoine hydroxylase-related dioxygenase (phytanoyl-CoA dioxygenase family)
MDMPQALKALGVGEHSDPGEIRVLAPAGTVVVFNSHLLHGGTLNITAHRRRSISSFFCRRDQNSMTQARGIPARTRARLSGAARYIVDADV